MDEVPDRKQALSPGLHLTKGCCPLEARYVPTRPTTRLLSWGPEMQYSRLAIRASCALERGGDAIFKLEKASKEKRSRPFQGGPTVIRESSVSRGAQYPVCCVGTSVVFF